LRRSTLRTGRRRRAAVGGTLAAALAAAALGTGCGATTTSAQDADTTRGKELFQQSCGACHVLADAGTQGQIGPNLDNAFRYAKADGFTEGTFFEVTLEQMKIPGPPMPDFDDERNKKKGNEDADNFLEEDDLVSVAAYVASVAGKGGGGQQSNDPKAIFTASCGSCHTFEDAGTSGTVGPNLDDAAPTLEEAVRQITNGGGGMPPFKGKLTDEQIQAVAKYVSGGGSRR